MSEPTKTRKIHLLVEAEVDEAEGFTDQNYRKIAAGILMKTMLGPADGYDEKRGLVFNLKDGDVSFQKPNPLPGTPEAIDVGGGVYWFI
jgi:hypothetical protein